MTYVTKEALFTAFETPVPESIPQEELRDALLTAFSILPLSGMKKTTGYIQPFGVILGDEINESRFTYENWDATAIDWDAIKVTNAGNMPTWKAMSQEIGTSTIEEFKGFIQQMFPNQLTEEEFFGK